jgi:hypothetical protein
MGQIFGRELQWSNNRWFYHWMCPLWRLMRNVFQAPPIGLQRPQERQKSKTLL